MAYINVCDGRYQYLLFLTVILKIRFYICPCLRMKKNKTMKKNCFLLLFLLCACLVQAQDTYRTDKDVP